MSATEAELIARYKQAKEEQEAAERLLTDHFMPALEAALREPDLAKARALVSRCPDSVTRVFMMDRLRQAEQSLVEIDESTRSF